MNPPSIKLVSLAIVIAGCDASTIAQQTAPPANIQRVDPPAPIVQSAHGKPDTSLTIIGWIIEQGGNDPAVIASQIEKLDCDVLALNEVIERNFELYNQALQVGSNCKKASAYFSTFSGRGDKLAIYYDAGRFEFFGTQEMISYRNNLLNDGGGGCWPVK